MPLTSIYTSDSENTDASMYEYDSAEDSDCMEDGSIKSQQVTQIHTNPNVYRNRRIAVLVVFLLGFITFRTFSQWLRCCGTDEVVPEKPPMEDLNGSEMIGDGVYVRKAAEEFLVKTQEDIVDLGETLKSNIASNIDTEEMKKTAQVAYESGSAYVKETAEEAAEKIENTTWWGLMWMNKKKFFTDREDFFKGVACVSLGICSVLTCTFIALVYMLNMICGAICGTPEAQDFVDELIAVPI